VTVGLKLSDFELVSRLMHSLTIKKFKTKVCEVLKEHKVKLIHDVPNCTFADMEKYISIADEYFRNDPDCVSTKFSVSIVLSETAAYQKKYNIKPDQNSAAQPAGQTGQAQRNRNKDKKQRAPRTTCFHCSSGEHKTQNCTSEWEATARICSSVKENQPCDFGSSLAKGVGSGNFDLIGGGLIHPSIIALTQTPRAWELYKTVGQYETLEEMITQALRYAMAPAHNLLHWKDNIKPIMNVTSHCMLFAETLSILRSDVYREITVDQTMTVVED
jgi:hypothetical protein